MLDGFKLHKPNVSIIIQLYQGILCQFQRILFRGSLILEANEVSNCAHLQYRARVKTRVNTALHAICYYVIHFL